MIPRKFYMRNPVVVEVVRLNEDNLEEAVAWAKDALRHRIIGRPGDWLVLEPHQGSITVWTHEEFIEAHAVGKEAG